MILSLITPSRVVVNSVEITDLKFPSSSGQVEVLPGHTSYQSVLGVGPLSFKAQGKTRFFAISYGFVRVEGDRVSVLAETCEESHEIDVKRAAAAQARAQGALKAELSQENFEKYQLKLQRSILRTQLSQHS